MLLALSRGSCRQTWGLGPAHVTNEEEEEEEEAARPAAETRGTGLASVHVHTRDSALATFPHCCFTPGSKIPRRADLGARPPVNATSLAENTHSRGFRGKAKLLRLYLLLT